MAGKGMVNTKGRATPKREDPAPLQARTADGLCGRCSGSLSFDKDLSGDKCVACGRLAGPPAETPESVRARVYAEISTLAEGLDPVTFWETYILASEIAAIIGMNTRVFRGWTRLNGFDIVVKRSPSTGKRAAFMEVSTAKELIRFRM